jgi:hypothetical protein
LPDCQKRTIGRKSHQPSKITSFSQKHPLGVAFLAKRWVYYEW